MCIPKISIIIPVYKAEPYIERCVRSLFGQTLANLEFIFVDDCSPDRSIEVMERVLTEYHDRKPQVKVIRHHVNQGVSTARQHGVDAASGEYIIHCDPDDWIEFNMYETMYVEAKARDADIVGCDFIEEHSSKQIIKRQNLSKSSEMIVSEILHGNIHASLWSRLISRKLIERVKVEFVEGITVMEDMLYVIPLHLSASNVSYIPQPLYHYRIVNDSITHTMSIDYINSVLKVIHKLKGYVIGNEGLYQAWVMALCIYTLPLINHPKTYNPNRWRQEIEKATVSNSCKNLNLILDISFFPPYKQLGIWLIMKHLDLINLIYIICLRYLQKIINIIYRI